MVIKDSYSVHVAISSSTCILRIILFMSRSMLHAVLVFYSTHSVIGLNPDSCLAIKSVRFEL